MKKLFLKSLALVLMLLTSVSVWADVYLTGTWDGWAHSGDLAKEVGGQVWLNLEANTTYEFKVYDTSKQSPWYGLSNAYMRDGNCTGWRLYNGDGGNCRFTTTFAGQYKFAIGWEDAGGSDGWVPTVTAIFPTVEPVATGELFGTYQQHDMPLFKENMTDPQKIGVDFYIATCGQHAVLRAISTGATTFNGDNWATQLRRVNAEGATQQEVQTCTNVSNKNHYTSGSCVRELNTTNEDIRFHFFVNGNYPAGVDGGYRKTTDFAFNRYSINNPIADDVAPVLDVENTTFVDNGDGTITITFGDVTADDEYFYYVADKEHNLGDIALDNTITLTKPTVQDGITYTLKAYAVDFNGNKSDAKEYSFTMPFDEEINLAENRPSYCGYQQQAGTGAEKANNTNLTDFWTCYGGPVADAWWKVDLVGTYDLNYIEMLWNDATGTYSIFGSTDDINWAPIVSGKAAPASQGTSADVITASARYIKMQFSSSNIGLKNVIIRGTGIAAADHTAPTLSLSEVSKTVTTATIGLEYADLDDNGGTGQIISIKISDTENGFAEREILSEISDGKITLSGLKDNTTYTFHVVVTDKAGNQTSKDLEVVLPFNTGLNLALNKPADAGVSQGNGVRAPKANNGSDKDFWTCFATGTADQWWWSVDLENLYQINHIYILYNDHAGTYTLNYSADGTVWHEYRSGFNAQLVDEKYISDFTAPVVARYFKFVSTAANVGIREFEVYGTGFAGADGTAPVIETFEAAATATNSVTLHIVATDKDDSEAAQPTPALTISDLANGLAEQAVVLDGDNKVVISGLKSNKTYNFLLTATDLAGNTANKNLEVALPYDTDFDWTEYATEETVWAGYSHGADTPIKATQATGHWGSYGISGDDAQEKNWWAIDLGVINEIRQITIDFEAERKYNIEYSFDDKAAADAGTATWLTAMANVDAGDADILNPNFAARMIRIHAQSASNMGIHRIHIKGSGWATTDAVAPQVTVTEVSKTTNTATLKIVASDKDDAGVEHPIKNIKITGDNDFVTIANAELDGEGKIELTGLTFNTTYHFTVTVTDRVGKETESTPLEVVLPFNTELDLAFKNPNVSAGYSNGADTPDRAVNGATNHWGTYQISDYSLNWWKVDLGAIYQVQTIKVTEGDSKNSYKIEGSFDNENWFEILRAEEPANSDEITHDNLDVAARYLRATALKNKMFTLRSFKVYASGFASLDTEKPVITSFENTAVTTTTATFHVVASDVNNVGEKQDIVYTVSGDHDFVATAVELDANDDFVLDELHENYIYHFTLTATDKAGNYVSTEPLAVALTWNEQYNLAKDGVATCGYQENGTYAAAKAIDENAGSKWNSYGVDKNAVNGYADNWMQVELEDIYDLSKVVISFDDASKNFDILGSLDGSNWYLIATKTLDATASTMVELPVVAPAKYVRFVDNAARYVGIYELEVYATGFTTLVDTKPVVTYAEAAVIADVTVQLRVDAADVTTKPITTYVVNGVGEEQVLTVEEGYITLATAQSTHYTALVQAQDAEGNLSDAVEVEFTTSGTAAGLYMYSGLFGWGSKTQDRARFSTTEVPGVLKLELTNVGTGDHNFKLYNADIDRCTKGDCGGVSDHYIYLETAGDVTVYATSEDQFITTADVLYLSGSLVGEDKLMVWNSEHTVATWSGDWSLDGDKTYTIKKINGTHSYTQDFFMEDQVFDLDFDKGTFTLDVTTMTVTWKPYLYEIVLDQTLDNEEAITSHNGKYARVTVNRSFVADGYWYTLCLPFDLSTEQCVAIFGEDMRIARLGNAYMKSSDMMYLPMDYLTEMKAGVPYLILPTQNVAAINVENVKILAGALTSGNELAKMYGFFSPKSTKGYYFLGDDSYLHENTATAASYAFRAYFTLNFPDSAPVGARARIQMGGTIATELEEIPNKMMAEKYMENGRVVIRMGNRYYNVRGQLMK